MNKTIEAIKNLPDDADRLVFVDKWDHIGRVSDLKSLVSRLEEYEAMLAGLGDEKFETEWNDWASAISNLAPNSTGLPNPDKASFEEGWFRALKALKEAK